MCYWSMVYRTNVEHEQLKKQRNQSTVDKKLNRVCVRGYCAMALILNTIRGIKCYFKQDKSNLQKKNTTYSFKCISVINRTYFSFTISD